MELGTEGWFNMGKVAKAISRSIVIPIKVRLRCEVKKKSVDSVSLNESTIVNVESVKAMPIWLL